MKELVINFQGEALGCEFMAPAIAGMKWRCMISGEVG
jgi:hypothetical protein